MDALFSFVFKFRAFLLFFVLEIISISLIINNNRQQSAVFFNTSNYYAAQILKASNQFNDYFHLGDVNKSLATENALLRKQLLQEKQRNFGANVRPVEDATIAGKYQVSLAKVVNSTTKNTRNYVTIEKGTLDGILPDMGVISPNGVVGRVKSCTPHLSLVSSALNIDQPISAQIKSNKYVSYVLWDGKNPQFAKFKDVTKAIKVVVGDTIVTSGFNDFFPEGTMIGKVEKVFDDKSATFHDITVRLSTDFNSLSYVYVIGNKLKLELDTLTQELDPQKEKEKDKEIEKLKKEKEKKDKEKKDKENKEKEKQKEKERLKEKEKLKDTPKKDTIIP